jgi:hypothetical protein
MHKEFWYGNLMENFTGTSVKRRDNTVMTALAEIGCEDQTWLELAQDYVPEQAFTLQVLNLGILLLQFQLTL